MSFRPVIAVFVALQVSVLPPVFASRPDAAAVGAVQSVADDKVFSGALDQLVNGEKPSVVVERLLKVYASGGFARTDVSSLKTAVQSVLSSAGLQVSAEEIDQAFAAQTPRVQAAIVSGQLPVAPGLLGVEAPKVAFLPGLEGIYLACMIQPAMAIFCVAVGAVAVVVSTVVLVSVLTREKEVCTRVGKRTNFDFDDRPTYCGRPQPAHP